MWVLYKKNKNSKNIILSESQVPGTIPFIVDVQKWQILRGKVD